MKPQTPEEIQTLAVAYFRVIGNVEVWTIEEDSGEFCRECGKSGFVLVGDQNYCVTHARFAVAATSGRAVVDILRPILVPDELAAAEDLLELVRNFCYRIAERQGSTVTVACAAHAEHLAARCNRAIKARR